MTGTETGSIGAAEDLPLFCRPVTHHSMAQVTPPETFRCVERGASVRRGYYEDSADATMAGRGAGEEVLRTWCAGHRRAVQFSAHVA